MGRRAKAKDKIEVIGEKPKAGRATEAELEKNAVDYEAVEPLDLNTTYQSPPGLIEGTSDNPKFGEPLSSETEKPYLDEGEEQPIGQDDALDAAVAELGVVTMEKLGLEKRLATANVAMQMALTLVEKHFVGQHIETVLREALGMS